MVKNVGKTGWSNFKRRTLLQTSSALGLESHQRPPYWLCRINYLRPFMVKWEEMQLCLEVFPDKISRRSWEINKKYTSKLHDLNTALLRHWRESELFVTNSSLTLWNKMATTMRTRKRRSWSFVLLLNWQYFQNMYFITNNISSLHDPVFYVNPRYDSNTNIVSDWWQYSRVSVS